MRQFVVAFILVAVTASTAIAGTLSTNFDFTTTYNGSTNTPAAVDFPTLGNPAYDLDSSTTLSIEAHVDIDRLQYIGSQPLTFGSGDLITISFSLPFVGLGYAEVGSVYSPPSGLTLQPGETFSIASFGYEPVETTFELPAPTAEQFLAPGSPELGYVDYMPGLAFSPVPDSAITLGFATDSTFMDSTFIAPSESLFVVPAGTYSGSGIAFVNSVPEPSTFVLLLSAIAGAMLPLRRRSGLASSYAAHRNENRNTPMVSAFTANQAGATNPQVHDIARTARVSFLLDQESHSSRGRKPTFGKQDRDGLQSELDKVRTPFNAHCQHAG